MKESRIGSEKLPSKLDEHLINKVEGATSLTSSATPDRIRFDTELKGYGSVSESGKHVQPAGGDVIVITDDQLRHFSPAQILGLHSSSQLTLSDVDANYVPESFKQLRKLLEEGFSELLKKADLLSSPEAVKGLIRLRMEGLEHEEFHVLWLNCANRLICADGLFRGTLSQTSIYPREVVKLALARNAAAAILVHNHPSGTAEQSRADELLTRSLKDVLSYVDVKVLDHLIVAPGHTPMSFAERGLI